MSNPSVENIRRAIQTGDYTAALELWNRYAAGIREALAGERLVDSSFAEAGALMEWSRPVLLCARAHAADRLRTLRVAAAYRDRTARPGPLIRASF